MNMIKLDIGCGSSKKEEYIGIDKLGLPGVDIIYDLNVFPYPFKDYVASDIWMDQILEHLDNPVKAMEEVYRISGFNAKIVVGVPYFRSFYSSIDPTHKNFFTTYWFDYFDPGHRFCQKYQYSTAKFKVIKIEFDREFTKKSLIHKVVVALANRHPHFYEENISHLYPPNSLTFYLEADK